MDSPEEGAAAKNRLTIREAGCKVAIPNERQVCTNIKFGEIMQIFSFIHIHLVSFVILKVAQAAHKHRSRPRQDFLPCT